MSKTFLKVKICSLAAESRIIKREETKWKRTRGGFKFIDMRSEKYPDGKVSVPTQIKRFPGTDHPLRGSLYGHRMGLRRQSRAANIAYGYLRGRTYRQIENKTLNSPDWHVVYENILKFGEVKDQRILRQRFAEWIDDTDLDDSLRPYFA